MAGQRMKMKSLVLKIAWANSLQRWTLLMDELVVQ